MTETKIPFWRRHWLLLRETIALIRINRRLQQEYLKLGRYTYDLLKRKAVSREAFGNAQPNILHLQQQVDAKRERLKDTVFRHF